MNLYLDKNIRNILKLNPKNINIITKKSSDPLGDQSFEIMLLTKILFKVTL